MTPDSPFLAACEARFTELATDPDWWSGDSPDATPQEIDSARRFLVAAHGAGIFQYDGILPTIMAVNGVVIVEWWIKPGGCRPIRLQGVERFDTVNVMTELGRDSFTYSTIERGGSDYGEGLSVEQVIQKLTARL